MEWLKLCAPNIIEVILNALILVGFVTVWLNPKIKQMNKKEDIRDEVVKEFWRQLQSFNTNCIEVSINVRENPETVVENMMVLRRTVVDMVIYKDTNKYDLDIFSEPFNDVITKWDYFFNLFQTNLRQLGERQIQIQLETALQSVKDANQNLISKVRDAY